MMTHTQLCRRALAKQLVISRPSPVQAQRRPPHAPAPCRATPRPNDAAPSSTADGSRPAQEDNDASEQHVRSGWDPEGLFSGGSVFGSAAPGAMDMFAARAMRRAQQAAAAARAEAEATPAEPQALTAATKNNAVSAAAVGHNAAGAVGTTLSSKSAATPSTSTTPPASSQQQQRQQQQQQQQQQQFADPIRAAELGERLPPPGERRDALSRRLQASFMPVNLDHPGLQLLHLDPPIFLVDNFLPDESCDAFTAAADATGRLVASQVGAGNVSGGGNTRDERRTSSSLLLDATVTAQHPALAALVAEVQEGTWRLLDGGKGWGRAGRMPAPQQYCFESPQVACYQNTQHFLSHEDGFPGFLARHNGFQRHATLLVYLNDVAKGGATSFDHLNVSVQPKRGAALLFFPSYSDGRPDERTLHCAEAAQDTKWITQQWVARGWGAPAQAAAAQFVPQMDTVKVPVGGAKQEPAGNDKKKGAGRKKAGFGAKRR